jgi:hypothetical protein
MKCDKKWYSQKNRPGLSRIGVLLGLLFRWMQVGGVRTTLSSALEASAAMDHCEGGLTMSINMDNEKNIPPYTEPCYETVASQEEMYLETTEEELRAILTSEPSRTTEYWRSNREKLEIDWELEIFHDRCK